MAKRKVRAYGFGGPRKYFVVDDEATKGAVIGQNLVRADGSRVTEAGLIAAAVAAVSSTPVGTATTNLWRLIREIPTIIKNLAALADVGFIRHSGSGVLKGHDWTWVKNSVAAGESVTIPVGRQLLVFREFTLDGGDVTIEGDLVIVE